MTTFSWTNSNDSTQIAGWSNAWEIARTIKIAKPSAVQSPHLFTSCQRIPDHVGESDCWSRRWKLSRLWFMWHLSQTTGNRWNGNGYFAPTSLLLTFSSFQHMVIVNYELQNKTKLFTPPKTVKREQRQQHHFHWSKSSFWLKQMKRGSSLLSVMEQTVRSDGNYDAHTFVTDIHNDLHNEPTTWFIIQI